MPDAPPVLPRCKTFEASVATLRSELQRLANKPALVQNNVGRLANKPLVHKNNSATPASESSATSRVQHQVCVPWQWVAAQLCASYTEWPGGLGDACVAATLERQWRDDTAAGLHLRGERFTPVDAVYRRDGVPLSGVECMQGVVVGTVAPLRNREKRAAFAANGDDVFCVRLEDMRGDAAPSTLTAAAARVDTLLHQSFAHWAPLVNGGNGGGNGGDGGDDVVLLKPGRQLRLTSLMVTTKGPRRLLPTPHMLPILHVGGGGGGGDDAKFVSTYLPRDTGAHVETLGMAFANDDGTVVSNSLAFMRQFALLFAPHTRQPSSAVYDVNAQRLLVRVVGAAAVNNNTGGGGGRAFEVRQERLCNDSDGDGSSGDVHDDGGSVGGAGAAATLRFVGDNIAFCRLFDDGDVLAIRRPRVSVGSDGGIILEVAATTTLALVRRRVAAESMATTTTMAATAGGGGRLCISALRGGERSITLFARLLRVFKNKPRPFTTAPPSSTSSPSSSSSSLPSSSTPPPLIDLYPCLVDDGTGALLVFCYGALGRRMAACKSGQYVLLRGVDVGHRHWRPPSTLPPTSVTTPSTNGASSPSSPAKIRKAACFLDVELRRCERARAAAVDAAGTGATTAGGDGDGDGVDADVDVAMCCVTDAPGYLVKAPLRSLAHLPLAACMPRTTVTRSREVRDAPHAFVDNVVANVVVTDVLLPFAKQTKIVAPVHAVCGCTLLRQPTPATVAGMTSAAPSPRLWDCAFCNARGLPTAVRVLRYSPDVRLRLDDGTAAVWATATSDALATMLACSPLQFVATLSAAVKVAAAAASPQTPLASQTSQSSSPSSSTSTTVSVSHPVFDRLRGRRFLVAASLFRKDGKLAAAPLSVAGKRKAAGDDAAAAASTSSPGSTYSASDDVVSRSDDYGVRIDCVASVNATDAVATLVDSLMNGSRIDS
jgi:hypothetical protein